MNELEGNVAAGIALLIVSILTMATWWANERRSRTHEQDDKWLREYIQTMRFFAPVIAVVCLVGGLYALTS
jgi:hypothetical protein